MQGAMKTPILVNDGVMKGEEGPANIGIFTVDPENPIYQDPFYKNDSTVLASFPFDHRRLDKYLRRYCVIALIFLVALSLQFVFPHYPFSAVTFCLLALLVSDVQTVWTILSTQRQRRCTHVAIATTGIILDEVTAPGSSTLKNRQIFKYEDYQQCHVQRAFNCYEYKTIEYDVILKPKNSMEPPFSLVKGLLGTQVFVDEVNAMIGQMQGERENDSCSLQVAELVDRGCTSKQDQMMKYNLVLENDVAIMDPEYPFDPDPFYENDKTVIASFHLDQNIFEKAMTYSCMMQLILVVSFALFLVLAFYTDIGDFLFVAIIPVLFFCLIWIFRSIVQQVQYVRRCTHIAVGQTGVYLDYVSEPGSRIHMCRSVFLYEDYDACYLEEGRFSKYFGYVEYRIMLKRKSHSDRPVVLSWGLLAPQLFAEKVQAMIEHEAEQR